MTALLLKFAIPLEEYELRPYAHAGPIFHRWLPEGQRDSIVWVDKRRRATMELWFERRGFVDQGMIEFDHHRGEVDPDIMARQAVLDAGPIHGLLTLDRVTDQTLAPVRSGEVGHKLYLALGKRVVKDILEPQLRRFLDILRVNYGQYWIGGLVEWDSRQRSLGQHCNLLNLQWSLDEGSTWTKFVPNEPKNEPITITLSPDRFGGLMTEQDWSELREVFLGGYSPSLAAGVLSRSHELLDQGAIKYALIEAVTALELATSDFMRMKLPSGEQLKASAERFSGIPLSAKAVVIFSLRGKIGSEDLEITVRAIEMRNKVVHEGIEPTEEATDMVQVLQKAVASLLAGPPFKFPPIYSGNQIYPPEGPGPKLFVKSISIS